MSFLNRFRITVGRVSSMMARACGNATILCFNISRPLRFAWFLAVFKSCNHNAHSVIARQPMSGTTGSNKRLYWYAVMFGTCVFSVCFIAVVHGWRVRIQVKYQMSTCMPLRGVFPVASKVCIDIGLSHLLPVISCCQICRCVIISRTNLTLCLTSRWSQINFTWRRR